MLFNKGNRLLVFRSQIAIKNNTAVPLSVMVVTASQDKGTILNTIAPEESDSVPLDLVRNGLISMKPSLERDDMSEWTSPIDCSKLKPSSLYITSPLAGNKTFSFHIMITEEKYVIEIN